MSLGYFKKKLSINLRQTAFLRLFAFFKIPQLFYLRPRVIVLDDHRCEICIPLRRRSRNHLNSMYFASLAAGADCAAGFIAISMIRKSGKKVSLIFKDFHAEFLKRAEGDVHFICENVDVIRENLDSTISSGERVNFPAQITAIVPAKSLTEPVARFVLTVSLKLHEKQR